MNDVRLEQQLRAALRTESDRRIQVDRAWNRFQHRRRQASRRRRRLAVVAAATAVAAVLVPVFVARLGGTAASHSGRPVRPAVAAPARDAVVARIPVANVTGLTSYGGDVWALTGNHELVRIDVRTNVVTLRAHVAGLRDDQAVVAGGGALWLDGISSSRHAELFRIDPATGAVRGRTNLPGASCGQAAYGLGHVWVLCSGPSTSRVLRIDPSTGLVDAQTGARHGTAYGLVAGSEGVWYSADAGPMQVDPSGTHLTGLKVTGSRKYLSVNSPDYIGALSATQLLLGDGALWALAGNVSGRPESIAAINPVTGRIIRAFTYSEDAGTDYDFWDLSAAVGQGSIWLLAPLGRNEIVRASMTTGRLLSLVHPGGSCRDYCSQIYDVAGAVWEPTARQIIRIDPARMPD